MSRKTSGRDAEGKYRKGCGRPVEKTKGEILRAFAKKNGLKVKNLKPGKPFQPIDLRGFPVFEPKPGTKPTILDEVNAAPRKIQKKAYAMCLRKSGLPKLDSSKWTHWVYADLGGDLCCFTGSKEEFDKDVHPDYRSAEYFQICGEKVTRLGSA